MSSQHVRRREARDLETVYTETVPLHPATGTRRPFTKASALAVQPGVVYDLWVEVFPVAAALPAGHSLRLAVQTSDVPHLSAPVPQLRQMAGGILSLYHDATRPSMIVVPFQS